MWFGTDDKMVWIRTPKTGANVSPEGYGVEATGLNGFGYVRNSWDSHKTYGFSWSDSSTPALASLLQSFAHGTYGRGLIRFVDPMTYSTNVLPRRVADPSMALNYEAAPLITGLWPRSTPTPTNALNLPVQTAIYDVPAGYDSQTAADEIVIPIPPGHTLLIGGVYSTVNALANVYFRTPAGLTTLTASASGVVNLHPQSVVGQPWVRIGLRNTSAAARAVSITALSARIVPPMEASDPLGPWMTGEGNSGCMFVGKVTQTYYSGVAGGQVGLACSLTETGAWA